MFVSSPGTLPGGTARRPDRERIGDPTIRGHERDTGAAGRRVPRGSVAGTPLIEGFV